MTACAELRISLDEGNEAGLLMMEAAHRIEALRARVADLEARQLPDGHVRIDGQVYAWVGECPYVDAEGGDDDTWIYGTARLVPVEGSE